MSPPTPPTDAAPVEDETPDPETLLTPRQEKAILALISSPTFESAAKACGIDPATLWRWREMPAFAQAYRTARRRSLEAAGQLLSQATTAAVRTLIGTMGDPSARPEARIRAAQVILEMAYRAYEVEDLAARLDALEASAAAEEGQSR